jgi:KipI family sensor histidine kinase inhibitor
MIALDALGERAFLVRFATEDEAIRWAETVHGRGWPGVVDVVLAYRAVAVFADPERVDLEELEARLRSLTTAATDRPAGVFIGIPVLYDGEDLPEVAGRLGLTVAEVVAAHSDRDYHVYAIGFLPGFPYAGYLPEPLCGLPRREVPRVRVPAGSVAIVGRQTAVYPEESPGGWHLIGRTPLRIVDMERGHFPIRAGDRLRFVPIAAGEFAERRGGLL